MADSYSQLYIQLIFVVKRRENLIAEIWEEELFKYINGILVAKGQKLMAINGVANHIHLLIGMKPSCRLSDLVKEIKFSSGGFINDKKFLKKQFFWQEGSGAFSYSKSAINDVINYIKNQKEHHRKTTFEAEYREFLKKFDVEYQEKYFQTGLDS
ncbi:MAG: IS200/IS605 family transposase [Sphingomonadales bacterium]|jgi:putative transposase